MAVSATSVFTLDADGIIARARARVGGERTSGYTLKSDRQLLQLFLTSTANNAGANLWSREWQTLTLSQGTGRYPIAADTIDVLQCIVRESNGTRVSVTLGADPISTTNGSTAVTITDAAHGAQIGETVNLSGASAVGGLTISGDQTIAGITSANAYTVTSSSAATSTATGGGSSVTATYTKYTDIELGRDSFDNYMRLPNKGTSGRPSTFYVERQRDNPVLYIYPVQNSTARHIAYLRKRRLIDVSALSDNVDIPVTFLNALISGLAALMAREAPQVVRDLGRAIADYDADAERDWQLAAAENRDRGPLALVPDLSRYFR